MGPSDGAGFLMNSDSDRPIDNQAVLRSALFNHARDFHIRAIMDDDCPRCGAEGPHAVAGYRQRNGVVAARGWCEVCAKWITGDIGGIPASMRTDEYLVILQDNTANAYLAECERCHAIGPVELHHWAPISLFDDAWDWPMSELCVDCHRRWHRVTGVATGRAAA